VASALLLGVDIGTTLTKVGLIDEGGREISHAVTPTPWNRESTGATIDPETLFRAVVSCTTAALAHVPEGSVLGVGVTSMAETAVLVDARGAPVGPAVAWYDTRARDEFARMKSELLDTRVARTTGLNTSQIPTGPTVRWLRDHLGASRDARACTSVSDWIVHRLGGEWACELSLASRTGLLDVRAGEWWPDALEWCGLDIDLMPPLRQAGSSYGRVREDLEGLERLGGATLTTAGHDHLCGSVGVGVNRSSQVMDSCGTAEALVRAVPIGTLDDLGEGHHLGVEVGWHVIPDHYALLGGLSLGLNLLPVLETLGVESRDGRTPLDAPALVLATEHEDESAVLHESVRSLRDQINLDRWFTEHRGEPPEELWWRVMQTAVTSSHDLLDGLEKLGGPVIQVVASGGWSKNPLLRYLKSRVFPPLTYPLVEEAGIRGSALLSGLAGGVFSHVEDFPDPPFEIVEPHRASHSPTDPFSPRKPI
jgi:sugar (pentulose or hexulose) kinase